MQVNICLGYNNRTVGNLEMLCMKKRSNNKEFGRYIYLSRPHILFTCCFESAIPITIFWPLEGKILLFWLVVVEEGYIFKLYWACMRLDSRWAQWDGLLYDCQTWFIVTRSGNESLGKDLPLLIREDGDFGLDSNFSS